MVNWKEVKCTHCESKKKCKKESVSKGSRRCQERLKLIPPKKDDTPKKEQMSTALLYNMYNESKGEKKDE